MTLCNSLLHCPHKTDVDITGGAHPSLSASLFGMCHSALLSTAGDFCITFSQLPCLYHCIVSFPAQRALGGSISNNLLCIYPLNRSTRAASKICPGGGNTAPSKGKSCHLKGVARCSAWVRWPLLLLQSRFLSGPCSPISLLWEQWWRESQKERSCLQTAAEWGWKWKMC